MYDLNCLYILFALTDIDEDTDKKKKSIGPLANVSIISNTSTISNTKPQSNKNGNIFSEGVKESVVIAATKQLTKKDKRNSSTALVVMDATDSTYLEKVSPSTQIKRKSSSVDITSNGPIVQMSTFSNGNSIMADEKTSSLKSNTVTTSGNSNDGSNIMTDSNSDAAARNLIAENSF